MRHLIKVGESDGVEVVGILNQGTMDTGMNRNRIAREFMNGYKVHQAKWLYWIDADNVNKPGTIRRALDVAGDNRTLVGGLYYKKFGKPWPVAFEKMEDGRYGSIRAWTTGEIFPVDAMGMNSLLSHISVYKDIDKAYIALQRASGGVVAIHREDIEGDLFNNMTDVADEKVINGLWSQRLYNPEKPIDVPFFVLEHGRTEDYHFFEKARRLGHKLWLDTSIEADHLTPSKVGGAEFRKALDAGEMQPDA